MREDIEDIAKILAKILQICGIKIYLKIMCVICHARLPIDVQFRSATVHSSVTQPEPASLGSVLP